MRAVAFSLPIVFLLAGTARADLLYSYVTDLPSYNTSSSIDVSVYLKEVSTGGSVSILDPANNLENLGGFRVKGTRTAGTAFFTGTSFNVINPTFDFGLDKTVSGGGTIVTFSGVDSANVGEISTSGGANIRLVLLGTLRITPGGLGDVSTFTLYDDDNLGGNNGAYTVESFYPLDVTSGTVYDGDFNEIPMSFAPSAYSFTVSNLALPEPASLSLLFAGSAALLMRKRKS